MKYIRVADADRARRIEPRLESCGNISSTGSVLGMQRRFNWPKGGQVRIGAYIYNVGPEGLAKLAALVRG